MCPSWSTRVPSTSSAISIFSPAPFRPLLSRADLIGADLIGADLTGAAVIGAAVFLSVVFWCVVRRSSLPATEDSVMVVISQVEQTPPTAARTHATAAC
ncbi:pentapeptide repeat-containing protein [Arthrobacter sp. Bi26]|uniref:pentapeptide repeat-containing protein n=1 Tax=Arthrobacter sp. Bi26 TaxID=2822350 RepID=UPI0033BF9DC3